MPKNLPHGLRLVAVLGLCSMASLAQATLITFDDLPWQPPAIDPNAWYAQPVTNQYASLGVVIDEGYLTQGTQTISPPQFLMGGPNMSITFTGSTLPRYVSLYLSAANENLESFVDAYGPGGFLGSGNTGGYTPGPDGSAFTPYVPNSYITFSSTTGISYLSFGNAYDLRESAILDNLYFGAVPAVPEPSSAVLAGVGLLSLLGVTRWQRRRTHGTVNSAR